jgi:integrase
MADAQDRVRVGEHIIIYPRGKKQIWCADFWRDGNHCRQSLKTANKKVALQKAMQLELDLVHGTFHRPPAPVSVRQAVDDYLTYLTTEGRARKTLVKYRGILDNLIAFLSAHNATRLSQITAVLFDRFRASRKQERHPKTMYCEAIVIKQFLKWAKTRKLLGDNPLADFKLSKPPLEPREGPSLDQLNRILAALTDPKRTMVALLAFTGMRSGELQRLKPEDVDLAGNWIHIRSREGAETKTRLSRKVPIHARLRPLLEALSRRPRPWLFTMPPSRRYPAGDHHLNVKRLNEDFLRVVASLGLPKGREGGFTLHSLRHFFETFTVNEGIPQRVVDTWLGHRSDRSMAAIYYRLKDEDSQRFMGKVPFGPACRRPTPARRKNS